MVDPTPVQGMPWTSERYEALVRDGLLGPDDSVELLEGVIVAVAPQDPAHAATVAKVADALRAVAGERGCVRVQMPLRAGARSVPEPDVALVEGRHDDYLAAHPTRAWLVVEVSGRSLAQDRLTKAGIYAAAAVPAYWIVNLRDGCLEVLRDPDREHARYRERRVLERGDTATIDALPGAGIAVGELLPPH